MRQVNGFLYRPRDDLVVQRDVGNHFVVGQPSSLILALWRWVDLFSFARQQATGLEGFGAQRQRDFRCNLSSQKQSVSGIRCSVREHF